MTHSKLIMSILCPVLLCISVLAGCSARQADGSALVICVESHNAVFYTDLAELYTLRYPNRAIEFVTLPSLGGPSETVSPDDREAALLQVRTQVMSGRGPDLFLLDNAFWDYNIVQGGSPLFPELDKSMAAGVFADWNTIWAESEAGLPADYIAPLLEAGQLEGGQYLLPLSCDVYALLMDGERWAEAAPPTTDFAAWADWLTRACGGWAWAGSTTTAGEPFLAGAGLPTVDVATGEVRMTTELLADRLAALEATTAMDAPWAGVPAPAGFSQWPWRDHGLWLGGLTGVFTNGDVLNAPLQAVAVPAHDGGLAAYMHTWAGVRANSTRKQEAWDFVRLLLETGVQTGEGIEENPGQWFGQLGLAALPVRAGCWEGYFAQEMSRNYSQQKKPPRELVAANSRQLAALAEEITVGARYTPRLRELADAIMRNARLPNAVSAIQAAEAAMAEWGRYLDE